MQWGAKEGHTVGIFDDPAIDGRVIDVDATLLQELFHMASGQRISRYQRMPIKMTSGGKCAPLKLTAMVLLPHESVLLVEEDHTENGSPTELRQNRKGCPTSPL